MSSSNWIPAQKTYTNNLELPDSLSLEEKINTQLETKFPQRDVALWVHTGKTSLVASFVCSFLALSVAPFLGTAMFFLFVLFSAFFWINGATKENGFKEEIYAHTVYEVDTYVAENQVVLQIIEYVPLPEINEYQYSVVEEQSFSVHQEIEMFETLQEFREKAACLESIENRKWNNHQDALATAQSVQQIINGERK